MSLKCKRECRETKTSSSHLNFNVCFVFSFLSIRCRNYHVYFCVGAASRVEAATETRLNWLQCVYYNKIILNPALIRPCDILTFSQKKTTHEKYEANEQQQKNTSTLEWFDLLTHKRVWCKSVVSSTWTSALYKNKNEQKKTGCLFWSHIIAHIQIRFSVYVSLQDDLVIFFGTIIAFFEGKTVLVSIAWRNIHHRQQQLRWLCQFIITSASKSSSLMLTEIRVLLRNNLCSKYKQVSG